MADARRLDRLLLGAGLLALGVAFALEGPGTDGLVPHMIQHVVLLTVAPPLLVLGSRAVGLPRRERPRLAGPGRPWLALVATTGLVQAAAMLAWHAPAAFDAALRIPPLHALEHATFLGSAVLFWWAVAGADRGSRLGPASLAVFVAALPGTLLGFGMTFARTPWYPEYVHGPPAAALRDQQVAGVVMWGFGGLASVTAAIALFVAWVVAAERRSPAAAAAPAPAGFLPEL